METETDLIFLGSKITADGDCSHGIKRCLLLGRKAMTNLDSVLKSRDITLLTKVHLVKAMVFPVVMYGCENWTIKKTEHWRIDVFELWCWRIFIWRTDAKAEVPILWPPDAKSWLIGRHPDAWKIKGRRRRGQQRMRWLDGITDSMDLSWASSRSWWCTGKPGVLQPMGSQRVGKDWATELKVKCTEHHSLVQPILNILRTCIFGKIN